ncbi:MAG: glycosyltransferase [Candidatus Eisenbacteria bacterium]|jgi:glycosyltransferase involved in cell wall biosynthesis|nr:glycosyltransferase [Candidatus Eisenbacteria bacterium]
MNTRVSVVIPTHNRLSTLSALLRSLAAQSGNEEMTTQADVIIVDDGSHRAVSDKVRSLVHGHPLRRIRLHRLESNRGPSAARNTGLALATGDIIAFLDDDCIVREDFLRETRRIHDENPGVLVLNGMSVTSRTDPIASLWAHYYDAVFTRAGETPYRVCGLSSGNFSIKRSLLALIYPLFDESLPSREDFDLYLRLKEKGIDVYKSDDIVVQHDPRSSILSLVRQRIWYTKGEYLLRKKYGEAKVVAEERAQWGKVRWRCWYLSVILGLCWRAGMRFWRLRETVGRARHRCAAIFAGRNPADSRQGGGSRVE